MTDPGLDMPTTVGSHAFATATVKKAALTADRVFPPIREDPRRSMLIENLQLTERGLIIIGKTNLTVRNFT
jgi:hypothetical protein